MGTAAEEDVDIEQMSSRYFLNSERCEVRKAFIGSIHASFVPKEDMLARPCKDFAISVNVRRARFLG
jgi:hypothetical protein